MKIVNIYIFPGIKQFDMIIINNYMVIKSDNQTISLIATLPGLTGAAGLTTLMRLFCGRSSAQLVYSSRTTRLLNLIHIVGSLWYAKVS